MLHVMRIGVEYASAIAFVPSNRCCRSDDAAATILAINWRCITATAAYAAIVIIIAVATVAAGIVAADGAAAVAIVIERHGNNSAIT